MSFTEPPSEADRGKETRRAHELGDRRKQNLTCVCGLRAKGGSGGGHQLVGEVDSQGFGVRERKYRVEGWRGREKARSKMQFACSWQMSTRDSLFSASISQTRFYGTWMLRETEKIRFSYQNNLGNTAYCLPSCGKSTMIRPGAHYHIKGSD